MADRFGCHTVNKDSIMSIDNEQSTSVESKRTSRTDGILDSVLDAIGDTPMVRLNRIGAELDCELCVKCEFFNAGGSVKDRIARQMILEAEKTGRIKKGDTLIEPTSGNTGIGIALCAAVRGYNCIITMPEKMSKEKVDVLKSLNATILRTPTEAAFDAPDSHISLARRLCEDSPDSHILDQYSNPMNQYAHYSGTAEEIIRQTGGKVDMIVAGAGTGGTISGIAKRLKEHNPDVIVVAVDPKGSILAQPDSINDEKRLEPYHVEGIGYDFIPNALDRSMIDHWYKSDDSDSLLMMRRLIRDEGLLCGGSSGAAVSAAVKAAKEFLKKGQRCVVILPDSVRNYMTKALSDDWMSDHGFVDGKVVIEKSFETWWAKKRVYDMPINTPLTITANIRCKDAIALLKREGFDMVPVLIDGAVSGVVTEGNITRRILSGRCQPTTTIAEAGVIYKTFHKFSMSSTLQEIARALDHDPFVLIVTEQRCFSRQKDQDDDEPQVINRCVVSGIVSRIDLLDFISSEESEHESLHK